MPIPARTQVGIVGGGPAGQLLARLLHRRGIAVVVLERRSRDYVEGRIRAGVLEQGTAAVLDNAAAGERMRREGLEHDGVRVAFANRVVRIDLRKHAGTPVFVYGQTEVTRDLHRLNLADGISVHFEVPATGIEDIDRGAARIHYESAGQRRELLCDFVAGCDGYHGVSRGSMPGRVLREFEKTYPFGWLGVLSETRPAASELIYSNHERGFALCSQRSPAVSRNYIQVPADDSPEQWSDDAFWDELRRRLPDEIADTVATGPSVEKSIAPIRSFVAEPLSCGRLFLVGDAGHIVPPTGAKGLNLAVSDTAMLASALSAFYKDGDRGGLERYSATALERIWNAERFSWWFTTATHRMSGDRFDHRIQVADLDFFTRTNSGLAALAENYVGLPIRDPVTGDRLV